MALHLHAPPHLPRPALSWEALRRPPRHSDESLTGTTRQWLRRLAPGRRPLRLCALYPRVANRIAWHWPDPVQALAVLDDLLTDRRGGRRGFPRPVQLELQRLRGLCAEGGVAPSPGRAPGCLDALRQRLSGH